jgi:hypothetical protein
MDAFVGVSDYKFVLMDVVYCIVRPFQLGRSIAFAERQCYIMTLILPPSTVRLVLQHEDEQGWKYSSDDGVEKCIRNCGEIS